MKKKKKYLKAPVKPSKTCTLEVRMTEEDFNKVVSAAAKSPEKNRSAYCRRKLLSKSEPASLSDEERQMLTELVAARTDIKRFIVAVEAATKGKPDEFRKQYILSLGVQRMWSPAVNRVFCFISDFLDRFKYDSSR